jgi:hypothetical protein
MKMNKCKWLTATLATIIVTMTATVFAQTPKGEFESTYQRVVSTE